MRDTVEHDLCADMMLGRKLIDAARRARVRDIEPGLGIGVRSPQAIECAATAVRHPQAGILAIPALSRVGIAAVIGVIGIEATAVRKVGAMPTLELHVIDERM